MSAAEEAYLVAENIIEHAIAAGDWLILGDDGIDTPDLEKIPPRIVELKDMKDLHLSRTRVTDLSPLSGATQLEALCLHGSPISDVSPLSQMISMTSLDLNKTLVSDIGIVRQMPKLTGLFFEDTKVTTLEPIQDLVELIDLNLRGTQNLDLSISRDAGKQNLGCLERLKKLQLLHAARTNLDSLQPLVALENLNYLDIADTSVSDLRPMLEIGEFSERSAFANTTLIFAECTATKIDPKLRELSEIVNDTERTQQTLAYLRETGENWPPVETEADFPPISLNSPEQEAAPRVIATETSVDVERAVVSEAKLNDLVRQKALERLRTAVNQLVRAGNRHPDLYDPCTSLRDHILGDLSEIDLLEVHFELEELRGIFDRRDERTGEDVFEPDVVSALDRVGLVGPGLTMDNAEVERFEARRGRYLDLPTALKALQENDVLSRAILDDPLYGEVIKSYSDLFLRGAAREQEPARLRAGQSFLNRNTVITVGLVFASGFLAGPMEPISIASMQWLAKNYYTINALAPGWGQAFQVWITPILMRARELSVGAQHIRP
ncbi:leucine-rich repeat domain-containing protein [Actibacterium sp. 188UL27-1]|uniref:leucine-rich repeat domain-containing protein n=1 Tax=Actibacterium sp. 188UL27-1 TaxID=2786961 RepID=UPI0019573D45|nr:hypothetical protein [Actibacterium sp. 188UL27-1]MBM7067838.1 hypothetical protein [Actibacterium sp. 188UL27-1]